MSKKEIKSATLSVRIKQEVRDFYMQYRGLTSKVLEDFYFQYKEMQEKKDKSEKKDNKK